MASLGRWLKTAFEQHWRALVLLIPPIGLVVWASETPFSLTVEAFAWMAMGVLLPVWLGRTVRNLVEAGRHSGPTPARPA